MSCHKMVGVSGLGLCHNSGVGFGGVRLPAVSLLPGFGLALRAGSIKLVPSNKACTGRLGLCAFFGAGSELWQFPVSPVGSPQPPVTQAVGQRARSDTSYD